MITIKFWTFQRRHLVKALLAGHSLIPDFSKNTLIEGASIGAYRYILSCYGNGEGLVFGHLGNSLHPSINSVAELYQMLAEVGRPGGSVFGPEEHLLLELNVPNHVPLMPIDFYKFSDLMFFEEACEEEEIALSKEVLFMPNLPNGQWELMVGHLPIIHPKWLFAVHRPKPM